MTGVAEKVFLDYTQDELDKAYDQQLWAPNFEELRDRNKARCAKVRSRLPHFERRYGDDPEETVEIVAAPSKSAPVVLFVHGGRWLPQPDNAFVHFADTIVGAGAHLAAARFPTLTPTPGRVRLPDMVASLRRCVAWLHRNAGEFGGDPERLHVLGHSSGGHLTSVLLTTDWKQFGVPENVFRTGTCLSGMYDLRPVMLSARSRYVQLSREEEDDLSAIRHLDRVRCPILVGYGANESPEFKRHGREFGAALKKAGLPSSLHELEGCNHFEVIASLQDPGSQLSRAVLAHMAL